MANIKFVVHGISKDKNGKVSNLEIAIGQQSSLGGCKIGVTFGTGDSAVVNYFTFSFKSFHFKKMMYSPNVIEADFQVGPGQTAAGQEGDYQQIDKTTLEELFTHKEVSLICTDGDAKNICEGYYVHQVIPRYKSDVMYVTMMIYSPDKMMTLHKFSRTFVAKKLGAEILEKQMKNFSLPYDDSRTLPYEYQSMVRLIEKQKVETKKKDSSDEETSTETKVEISKEHIFPYLYQFNESFYDFLARTTNRWGEFMFYEGKQLHFGYQTDEMILDTYSKRALDSTEDKTREYTLLTLHDLTSNQLEEKNAASYTSEASYDSNILKSTVVKNTYDAVKNTAQNAFSHENGATKYWLGKVSSLFTNDKPFFDWLVGNAVDDALLVATTNVRVATNNGRIRKEYFDKEKDYIPKGDEHYSSDGDTYNEFSEYSPMVDEGTYLEVLKGERNAAMGVIKMDFDTTYPNLELGQIIVVMSKEYIVVEIESYQKEVMKVVDGSVKDGKVVNGEIVKTIDQDLRFLVTATAKDTTNKFYPMMIPAGHVRTSGPQVAVVVDVDDPTNCNRVRVIYPWESGPIIKAMNAELGSGDQISKCDDIQGVALKIKDKNLDLSTASPWLLNAVTTATDAGGQQCRHELGEKVLIDYAFGNVERPYVTGSVVSKLPPPMKFGTAVLMATNGEMVRVHEGLKIGAEQFMANFLPATKFINGFVPISFGINTDEGMALEGGVELTDKFGIWSISGSTHERKVAIKSPWGDVAINAFTGITISAPNGNVKISGKNVTIEAGNNLTLTSGKNIKNKFFALKQNGEHLGIQIAAAVALKLASLGLSLLDISFIRAIIDLFFRPLEGLTTIKSNRFLKLEAGSGNARYPDAAYTSKVRKKEMAKEMMRQANGTFFYNSMFDKLTKLIGTLNTYSSNIVDEIEQKIVSSQHVINSMIVYNTAFKNVSDTRDTDPCVINDIANFALADNEGENPKKIKDEDFKFKEGVAIDDVKEVTLVSGHFSDQSEEGKAKINETVLMRKYYREVLVEEANKLSELSNEINSLKKQIWTGADQAKKLQLKSSIKYAFDDSIIKKFSGLDRWNTIQQDVTSKIPNSIEGFNTFTTQQNKDLMIAYISRSLAICILDAIGYDDATRTDITKKMTADNNAAVAPAPTTFDDVTNSAVNGAWYSYVDSIKYLSLVKKDKTSFLGALDSKLTMATKQALSQWNLAIPFGEYFTWADNKDGKILFSAGTRTYALDNSMHEQPISDAMAASGIVYETESNSANKYIGELRDKLNDL